MKTKKKNSNTSNVYKQLKNSQNSLKIHRRLLRANNDILCNILNLNDYFKPNYKNKKKTVIVVNLPVFPMH